MCDGHAIKSSESSLAQWNRRLRRNSTIFYRPSKAHQPLSRLRKTQQADCDKVRQRRSCGAQRLNVRQRVRVRLFACCGLAGGISEQPANAFERICEYPGLTFLSRSSGCQQPVRQNSSSMGRTSWTTGEHFRRVTKREWRGGGDGRGFKVPRSRFSELRTANFGSRLSRASRTSSLATSICVTPPSFEVPLLGLTNSAAILYSSGWRGTQGGHHDLHTLSGLYGERSFH